MRPVPLAVDSTLAIGLVLVLVGAASPPVARGSPPLDASTRSALQPPDPTFTVDPPTFWMRTGENVSLLTVWSAGSPLCRAVPLWYRWSVTGEGATGFLNAATAPTATFAADSFDSGEVDVTVRSGAAIACGANQTVLDRSFSAVISIVVPLAVTGVHLTNYSLLPGGNTSLEGNVSGGSPPYALDVVWDDGTRTNLSLPSPRSFEANHTFAAGGFLPYVVVVDSGGDLVNRSVPESLDVGSGPEATVLPASYVAEVGVPTDFLGVVTDPVPGAVALYDCSDAVVGPPTSSPPVPNATGFSCTFESPGTEEVLFGSIPPEPGGASASAVLYEVVVPPPTIGVFPVTVVGEVGGFVPLRISLTGGALPVAIHWNLTGNRSSGSTVVDTDGGGVVGLTLGTPGECPLGIQATDVLGGVTINDSVVLEVFAPLDVRADGASAILSSGALAQVSGAVLAGLPPFFWWAVPDLVPPTGQNGNGSLATVGGFSWQALYAREGDLELSVGAADASGAVWQTSLVIGLVPPLSAELSVAPGPSTPNETLEVGVVIEGGWPPFQLFVNASDNETWNRTLPTDGPYQYSFPTRGNGTLLVTISVIDSLGGLASICLPLTLPAANTTGKLPPPAGVSGSSNDTATASTFDVLGLSASFAVAAGTALAAALLWRRRAQRRGGTTPGPDPEAVLKRIIEPADGAERFTVELLAEEAGIPLSVVRATIDRLVSEGRVHSESGADGEEVLSWSSEGGH